ncbi:PIN domain-like protein, partial [Mycena leptocephala]
LETLFFKLCNLQHAPVIAVFVFDGPGRPAVKRGIRRVRNNPLWLTAHLKESITSFGYYHYAPGEAEAELAQLKKLGFIDVVITEDSDTVAFGAPCVMRTHLNSPYVTDASEIYRSESTASHPLYLDEDGLLLFVLLVGGDHDRGISSCGPRIAHGLAHCGFGRDLRNILTSSGDAEQRDTELAKWRAALRNELRSNSSRLLDRRYPKLAENINRDFPNFDIIELYTDPLTSWSSSFTPNS